jgi:hypothetical protein
MIIGRIAAQYASQVTGIPYRNRRAKKGRIIVMKGIHQAIIGAKKIFDTATYIRAKGTKFRELKWFVKSICDQSSF